MGHWSLEQMLYHERLLKCIKTKTLFGKVFYSFYFIFEKIKPWWANETYFKNNKTILPNFLFDI